MKTVYIAHPLGAGPDREINRRHAAKWVAWAARECAVAPIATWITLSGEWEETPENRELGLLIDVVLIARCAELWLVGGRLSPGMMLESDAARDFGVRVVDLLHLGVLPPPPGGR